MPKGETHSNLIGKKFNKLTPIKYIPGSKWLCKCDCGNETVVQTSHLTTNHTKSCGCLNTHKAHTTHGLGKPDTYSHWYNIKSRCFNKKHPRYKDWGGRGITMYEEWKNNFKTFHEYVIRLPNYNKEGYTSIDRINNDGNYEPGNIRWATPTIQNNNKRKKVVE